MAFISGEYLDFISIFAQSKSELAVIQENINIIRKFKSYP